MKWFGHILQLLYKLYFALLFLLTLLLLYPVFFVLLLKEGWYKYAFKVKKWWAHMLLYALFIRVRKQQVAELPTGTPYIICPNHASYLDIIMLYRTIPNYFAVIGKAEILKWPLFRIFFRTMNIAVDRESNRSGHTALRSAGEEIDKGNNIVIFPEGGIPHEVPIMRPFKNGAFKLAIEKQVPIVPVTYVTNWRIFSDMEKLWGRSRPGVSHIIVHAPIATKGMTQDDLVSLRTMVFAVIEQPLLDYENRRHNRR